MQHFLEIIGLVYILWYCKDNKVGGGQRGGFSKEFSWEGLLSMCLPLLDPAMWTWEFVLDKNVHEPGGLQALTVTL